MNTEQVTYLETPAIPERVHTLRSIGNAVGTAPFKNTNRKNPAYKRRKDRIARRNGFMSAEHQAIFITMLAAAQIKRSEEAQ